MKNSPLRNINANEFDWLEYCTACNTDCCHNVDSSIPKYECKKPGIEIPTAIKNIEDNIKDYRPFECQIFPFDVMELDGKLEWVKQNNCYATPKLNYEKFIGYFEKKFFSKWPKQDIEKYVREDKLNNPQKYLSDNFTRIREVSWLEV
jgi:hypothetical protein